MPAVAFAVSGRGRAVSPWLNLVERLVGGWSLEPATNWPWRGIHRRVQPLAGSVREWGRAVRGPSLAPPTVTRQNAGGLLRIPDQRCDSTEQSLYERLGGVNAIAMVVGRFSDKIVEDAKLNVNPQLQEWKGLVARPEVYADAVALCSGWGPFQYTGKELHEAIGISASRPKSSTRCAKISSCWVDPSGWRMVSWKTCPAAISRSSISERAW